MQILKKSRRGTARMLRRFLSSSFCKETTMKRLLWLLLTIGLSVPLAGYAEALSKGPTGTEGAICMHQARENPAAPAEGVGATPGISGSGAVGGKSGEEKRGNTPPGTSRAGDAPADGAIVDPAGVTKR